MPEHADTPGRFPVAKGLGALSEEHLPGIQEAEFRIDGITREQLGRWLDPFLGDGEPIPPFRCRHDKGTYGAEKVDVNGKLTYQHRRCRGCHIILETRKIK